jgi:MinD superfamily P-loop ATPase
MGQRRPAPAIFPRERSAWADSAATIHKKKTPMNIAIASGKGGTGKTTVATNLARVAARDGRTVACLDCDVEEPNAAIFLNPTFDHREPITAAVPEVDLDKCIHCGKCGEICQYGAIVSVGEKVLVYEDLCHGCAGCWLVCPTGAISETRREIGQLEAGDADGVRFVHGVLNIGEAMSPPAIAAVKAAAPEADLVIVDSPPGTSCPVIEAVRGSEYVVLVGEPTPFGLNDLKLSVETLRKLKLPFGVVINRAGLGDDAVARLCRQQRIPVLAEIPDDRRIAEAYSRGELVCDALPEFRAIYEDILRNVTDAVQQGSPAGG